MVKAHSLLYAIYICLIVSLLCAALLYFANLYGQLNVHYNLREELYLHNQSLVNFALGNKVAEEEIPQEDNLGITGAYTTKPYGLLTLLVAKSFVKNDTVASASIIGYYNTDKTAINLANLSKSLSYTGRVELVGNLQLPSPFIEPVYLNKEPNHLTVKGKSSISEMLLPELRAEIKNVFEPIKSEIANLAQVDKPKDSLYFNSFFKTTKEINVKTLNSVIFKGNFVLRSNDSIRVKKNTVLEDVILIAPTIIFEEGFKGTVQAFATTEIKLEQKVTLKYPSALCLYNKSTEESRIFIEKESKVTGAVILFGSSFSAIEKHSIEIEEGGLVLGDVYCSGKLGLKSNVYGSVYTNRFFHRTKSSTYHNTIANVAINTLKRPAYFIAIPLFESKKKHYGILKKVL